MCYSCVTPDWTLQVQADLAAAQAEAAKFNSRETLFELELTDYSRIKKMGDQFDPFFQFWNTAANRKKWQKSWMMDPFIELDSEQVNRKGEKTCLTGVVILRSLYIVTLRSPLGW